jgi:hypothetical protein
MYDSNLSQRTDVVKLATDVLTERVTDHKVTGLSCDTLRHDCILS